MRFSERWALFWKIWRMKHAVRRAVCRTGIKCRVHWLGLYWMDPRLLAFWICVKTDEQKKTLESNEQLKQELSSVPDRYNYPQPDSPPLDFGLPDVEQLRKELPNLPDGFELRKAEQGVGFTFESQETVDRLYNGSWYEAMK